MRPNSIVKPRRKAKPKYKVMGQVEAMSVLDEIIDYFDCRDEQRLSQLAKAVWHRLNVMGAR